MEALSQPFSFETLRMHSRKQVALTPKGRIHAVSPDRFDQFSMPAAGRPASAPVWPARGHAALPSASRERCRRGCLMTASIA